MAAKAKSSPDSVAPSESNPPRLSRPRRARGTTLRNWLATRENRFGMQRINDCQAQLLSLATAARHPAELRLTSKKLSADVATELNLYHFCYYHLLMRLELMLEEDQLGRALRDKLQGFIDEFRSLWILAIALDRRTDQTYYRSVARRRYMELSQLYFGRSLQSAPGTFEPDEEDLDDDELDESDLIVPGDEPPPGQEEEVQPLPPASPSPVGK